MTGAWPIRAVIFDLGGVVLGSPIPAIARLEKDSGIPPGSIGEVLQATDGAWARHERGEIAFDSFIEGLECEFRDRGLRIDVRRLMAVIEDAIDVRPQMIEVVSRVRAAGYRVAALTNNWEPFGSHPLREEFDVFVESVVEGVRKPEPEIYQRCLQRLGVEAEEAVMLDDLGPNLEPARRMGMRTIKVDRVDQAVRDLEAMLGTDLSVSA